MARPAALIAPAPAREEQAPRLRVAPRARRLRLRRRLTAVTLIVVGVSVASLFAVATFQTVLVQGQARLDRLGRDIAAEQARYARLRAVAAGLEAPDRIVAVAQQRLGMVPPATVAYVMPTPQEVAEVAAATGTVVQAADLAPAAPGAAASSAGGGWSALKPYVAATP